MDMVLIGMIFMTILYLGVVLYGAFNLIKKEYAISELLMASSAIIVTGYMLIKYFTGGLI